MISAWTGLQSKIKSEGAGSITVIVLIAIFIAFAPILVAIVRRYPNKRIVAVAYILALISWVAWLAVLAWAATGKRKETIERLLRRRD